jgi:hypothetical protein
MKNIGNPTEDENQPQVDRLLSFCEDQLGTAKALDMSKKEQLLYEFQRLLLQHEPHLYFEPLQMILNVFLSYNQPILPEYKEAIQNSIALINQLNQLISKLQTIKTKKEMDSFYQSIQQILDHSSSKYIDPKTLRQAEEAIQTARTNIAQRKQTSTTTVTTSHSAIPSIESSLFAKMLSYISKQYYLPYRRLIGEVESLPNHRDEIYSNILQFFQTNLQYRKQASVLQLIDRWTPFIETTLQPFLKEYLSSQSISVIHSIWYQLFEQSFLQVTNDLKTLQVDSSLYVGCILTIIQQSLTNKHLKKSFTHILSIFLTKYSLLIPDLCTVNFTPSYEEELIASFRLFTALLAYANYHPNHHPTSLVSPLPISMAWSWLYHFGEQIHLIRNMQQPSQPSQSPQKQEQVATKEDEKPAISFTDFIPILSWRILTNLIKTFLNRCSAILSYRYQQTYSQLIQQLMTILQGMGGTNDIINMLQQSNDQVLNAFLPTYYQQQDTFLIQITIQQYHYHRREVPFIQQIEHSYMPLIEQYQIDKIPSIFNRISATIESQNFVIQQLLEKVTLNVPPEITKYIIFQIVIEALEFCQEDNFNPMKEALPTSFVRVLCGVCHLANDTLSPILRDGFIRDCPLLLPKLFIDSGHMISPITQMLLKPQENILYQWGYKYYLKTKTWEKNLHWLNRMRRILCVFALFAIQPEQLVFTIHDIWNWLVRLSNLCHRMIIQQQQQQQQTTSTKINNNNNHNNNNNNIVKLHDFIPSMLEIVIGITLPTLYTHYQQQCLQLLQMYLQEILPKFSSNIEKKEIVEKSLKVFIESNGQTFMSLFSDESDLIES